MQTPQISEKYHRKIGKQLKVKSTRGIILFNQMCIKPVNTGLIRNSTHREVSIGVIITYLVLFLLRFNFYNVVKTS